MKIIYSIQDFLFFIKHVSISQWEVENKDNDA
jgi:hypothetical protein